MPGARPSPPTPSQTTPSWARFDLGARYATRGYGGKPLVLRAAVENVADRNYYSSATGLGGVTFGAPRTLVLSVAQDF